MSAEVINALARQFRPEAPPLAQAAIPLLLSTATVTGTAPFTIDHHGTSVPDPARLASYAAPVVGDVVLVLTQGSTLFVLGAV
jgi:hypothetical protein